MNAYTVEMLRPSVQRVIAASHADAVIAAVRAVPGCVVRSVEPAGAATPQRSVYIAGPMTGCPEHNYPAFMAAAAAVRAAGLIAVNPAELNPDTTTPYAECMKVDIRALIECDAVLLLDGWMASRGANVEAAVAEACRLRFLSPEILADYAAEGIAEPVPPVPEEPNHAA